MHYIFKILKGNIYYYTKQYKTDQYKYEKNSLKINNYSTQNYILFYIRACSTYNFIIIIMHK